MTEEAPTPSFQAHLNHLDKLAAAIRRHDDAIDKLRKEAGDEAVAAVRAGFTEGIKGVRAKVLRHAPFSHTTLRDVLEAAGIAPDERYDRSGPK